MEFHTSAANNSGQRKEKECSIITINEFSLLLESHTRKWPDSWHDNSQPRCQIHRVPLQLRQKDHQHVYSPIMVSLGPCHHGKPEFRQAEEFKYLCLDWCCSFSEEKKASYNKILENIDEIRGYYADVSVVEKYDDKALALMMLLDACFILNYMENQTQTNKTNFLDWRNCLGVAGAISFAARDIMLLENQIPFLVLNLVISLKYEKEEREELVKRFLSWMLAFEVKHIPRENEEPPIHILEALWRVITDDQKTHPDQKLSKFTVSKKKKDESSSSLTLTYQTCHSVTYLKSKGIYFSPSSSHSLKDVNFVSHALFGQLQLPVCYVSEHSQVRLSNLIAYEISPNTKTDLTLLSYANLMKSLIENPADVKELQESGVMFKRFANNEQVVEVLKNIDTCGLVDFDIFADVKFRVEEHCSNKVKTWIGNVIQTRFRSPWTVSALLASILLFCFTFLQTFFTIRPASKIT